MFVTGLCGPSRTRDAALDRVPANAERWPFWPIDGRRRFRLNPRVLFYALVSAQARETVEIYADREQAEAALADALGDVPEWEGTLWIELLDLGASSLIAAN
jgi:hypothetical protein